MNTQVRTPNEIFNQPQRLLVPLFQRPYVWNEELQWAPLWKDVEHVAGRVLANDRPQPHFLGAVVLQQVQSSTGDLPERIVIDGQQRLTTLQLVLDAIHASFIARGFTNQAKRVEMLIENSEAFRGKPEDKFKVWPTNRDRVAFNEVMGCDPSTDYSSLQHRDSRLVKAHEYFRKQVDAWLNDEEEFTAETKANALDNTVRGFLQVVVIDLYAEENAQEIFETLNARGTPLTAVDLIKNFVFQKLLDLGVNVEEIYHKYWEEYETPFWESLVRSGAITRQRAVTFFNHWLFATLKDTVASNEVFQKFKHYFNRSENVEILGLVQNIYNDAKGYAAITREAESSVPNISKVGIFAYRAEAHNSDLYRTILLALYDSSKPKIPESVIELIVKDIESWLVRRSLVWAPTNGHNRFFIEIINLIDRYRNDDLHKHVRDILTEQTDLGSLWPDDLSLRTSLKNLPVYTKMYRARLRMLLEAIEDYYRGFEGDGRGLAGSRVERNKFSIEHLMPQGWEANWPEPTDEFADSRENRIHTLGNLTLVTRGLNSSISNGPWSGPTGKQRALLNHNVLLMNSRLQSETPTQWDDAAIDQRTEALIEVILKIWPVPEGHANQRALDTPTNSSYLAVVDLIASGRISAGQKIHPRISAESDNTATVLEDGKIRMNGVHYNSLSGAARFIRGRATNGWWYWVLSDDPTTSFDDLRLEYLKKHGPVSDIDVNVEDGVEDDDTSTLTNPSLQDLQLSFWQQFHDELANAHLNFSPTIPQPNAYMLVAGTYSNTTYVRAVLSSFSLLPNIGSGIRVDLLIRDNHKLFDALFARKQEIETAIGSALVWHKEEGVASTKICLQRTCDIYDRTQWPNYTTWLISTIDSFAQTLGPIVEELE